MIHLARAEKLPASKNLKPGHLLLPVAHFCCAAVLSAPLH